MNDTLLHPDLRDAMRMIEFAATGKITIQLTLNQLIEQRQTLSLNCDELEQQIADTQCKMERAQEHFENAILNLLRIKESHRQ